MSRRSSRLASSPIAPAALLAVMVSAGSPAQTASSPAPTPAPQNETYQLEIPAQPLGEALQAFARLARQQVSFDSATTAGKTSRGISGRYTAEEALARLLDGAGLKYRLGARGVWLVTSETGPSASSHPSTNALEDSEVIVTGTHIRGAEVAAPLLSITRQDFERRAYQTLENVLEELPQNFAGVGVDTRWGAEGGSVLATSNTERITAIDLRGLGAESTLTLVNGMRRAGSANGRAVDISAIPLAAVERVEIVTGGRSAIYGTDAVAGVVNIITRKDFSGVELEGSYSAPTEFNGGTRLQVSGITGAGFDRGGVLGAYTYSEMDTLNIVDTGFVTSPVPLSGDVPVFYDGFPSGRKHALLVSGNFRPVDPLTLSADMTYTDSTAAGLQVVRYPGATIDTRDQTRNAQEIYAVHGGAEWQTRSDWRLSLDLNKSQVDSTTREIAQYDFGDGPTEVFDIVAGKYRTDSSGGKFVVDGPLFSIGSVRPHVAAGVEYRRERFDRASGTPVRVSENVKSTFAELQIPFADASGRTLVEASLAGRYDDYGRVGGAFNPQAGLIYRPTRPLTLRATYGESFRAPSLIELTGGYTVQLVNVPDPASSTGTSPVMRVGGNSINLDPETSQAWTVGLDYAFERWPRSQVSVSYFDIQYEGRIDFPAFGADSVLFLTREERYPGLIDRSPSEAELDAFFAGRTGNLVNITGRSFNPATQQFLDVFPGIAVFDNRKANIAVESMRGIDLLAQTGFDASLGRFTASVNASYTLDHDRRVTPTSPAISRINEVQKPVDFRMSVDIGWSRGAWRLNLGANHVAGYANPFTDFQDPAAPPQTRIGSWTTVGLTVGLNGDELHVRPLAGLAVALNVDNLFNSAPPRFEGSLFGLAYDPTNANPFGRIASLTVRKKVH